MLGKTHIITNTAVCLGVTMAAGFIGFGSASAVALGAVEGSILPDIDQKYSYAHMEFSGISDMVRKFGQHRTWTHSLIGWGVFTILAFCYTYIAFCFSLHSQFNMAFRVVATVVLITLGFFCMGYWRDDRVLSLMPLCFGWALFAQYNYVMVFLFGIAMVASYGLHLLEDSFSFAGIRWGYPFTASSDDDKHGICIKKYRGRDGKIHHLHHSWGKGYLVGKAGETRWRYAMTVILFLEGCILLWYCF